MSKRGADQELVARQERMQTEVSADIVREIAQRAADKINLELRAKKIKEEVDRIAIRIATEKAAELTQQQDIYESARLTVSMIAAELEQAKHFLAKTPASEKKFEKAKEAARKVEREIEQRKEGSIVTETLKRQRIGPSPMAEGAGAGAIVPVKEEEVKEEVRREGVKGVDFPGTESRIAQHRERRAKRREANLMRRRRQRIKELQETIESTDADIMEGAEVGQIDEILQERQEAVDELASLGVTDVPPAPEPDMLAEAPSQAVVTTEVKAEPDAPSIPSVIREGLRGVVPGVVPTVLQGLGVKVEPQVPGAVAPPPPAALPQEVQQQVAHAIHGGAPPAAPAAVAPAAPTAVAPAAPTAVAAAAPTAADPAAPVADAVEVQDAQGEPLDVAPQEEAFEEVDVDEGEAPAPGPGADVQAGETPGDGADGRDDIMDPDEQNTFKVDSFQWATGDTNYYTRESRAKLGYGQGDEANVQPIEPFGVTVKPALDETKGDKAFKQSDPRFEPFRGQHEIVQQTPQEKAPGASEDESVRPFAQKPFAKVGGEIIWIPFYGKTAKMFFTSEDYQELVSHVVEEGGVLKLKAPAPDMVRKMQSTIDEVRTSLRSYDLPKASLRHGDVITRYAEWLELKQIMKAIAKYQKSTTGMYNQAGLFSGNLREAVSKAVDEAVAKISQDRKQKLARGLQSANPRGIGGAGVAAVNPSQLPAYNPFMRKDSELERVNTTLPRFF